MQMVYHPGHENARAGALSRNPVTAPIDHNDQARVSQVSSMDISQLLKVSPQQTSDQSQGDFSQEQLKDPDLKKVIQFLETGNLPYLMMYPCCGRLLLKHFNSQL